MKHKTGRIRLLLAAFFLTFLCIMPGTRSDAAFQEKGIDVSRWQGTIDWAKVKKAGIKFVMIGIGRYENGKRIPDPTFTYNIKNAIAQDIKVGVYLYSKATTTAQAKEEADFVLDMIDGYKISYPVAFDIEDTVHKTLTTKKRTDITIAFLSVIEEAGYHPAIYASENWFNESMDLTRLTKYDKWVARWAASTSFKPHTMWQYSSTGKVNGINTAVDLDYSYVDYAKVITPRTQAAKRRSQEGWKTDGTHYWYQKADGSRYKNGFVKISGKKYYFDKNGYRASGWTKIGKKSYYFKKDTGVLQTGWLTVNGEKYYLDPSTGARQTGWKTIDKNKYYFKSNGAMATSWQTISGKKYYFVKDTGRMKTGWMTLSTGKYYLNKSGVLLTGFRTVTKNKYYFAPDTGKLLYGWNTAAGKRYYSDPKNGRLTTGWITVQGEKYYMNSNGAAITGWKKISGKWYYFGPKTGAMQKSKTIGKYTLDSKGVCTNRK